MIWNLRHTTIVFSLLFFNLLSGQEDIASTEEMLVEQQNINFQTFFFEALQQKAIGNHDKAIFALEACNNIERENKAVLFELSKNYVALLKYTEAAFYGLKALELDPENLFLLENMRDIKSFQNDYEGAILFQQKLVEIRPEYESDLVILYIKSGKIDQAVDLLKKLDAANQVPAELGDLKKSLLQESSPSQRYEEAPDQSFLGAEALSPTDKLREEFALKSDFESLMALLDQEVQSKDFLMLLEDSSAGLELFPAQTILYLYKGKALNNLRKHKEALEVLEEGLAYLIEDPVLEGRFYQEMSLALKAMGRNKEASEYQRKAEELKG